MFNSVISNYRLWKSNISLAAAAKWLQSCPTLCNPIDGSPPGSPVPGILQARTLEWVAISFSNAWKWKVKVKSLSRWDFVKGRDWVSLGGYSEKALATHSSTLAWKIPWTEEPGRLQSMGLLGVGHDWATSFSLFLSCIGEGNGNPLQCSCLENPRGGAAWWAAIYGVAQSRTRLKPLSSSMLYTCN